MRDESTFGASMSSTSLSPGLPSILIVSPALAAANNGNWHTASRWARMLAGHCRIGIAGEWRGEPCDLMVALHARRSAASIDAYARARPRRPLVVVLTGTDLYRDIRTDPRARRSLELASHLVALQDRGPLELAAQLRRSAARDLAVGGAAGAGRRRRPGCCAWWPAGICATRKTRRPSCAPPSACALRADIRFEQIGGALEPALRACRRAHCGRRRALPLARQPGACGDAPAHPPRPPARQHQPDEGGAQVIIEAAQAAPPCWRRTSPATAACSALPCGAVRGRR